MAITFKSKVENIVAENTFNGFTLTYRFNLVNGVLNGNASCDATRPGQVQNTPMMSGAISNQSTSDGINFHGSVNSTITDDLTGLIEQMKADLAAIVADPLSYSGIIVE